MYKSSENECIRLSISLLIEDVEFSNSLSALMTKTETCKYPDQPGSLNTVGQLEAGGLHWHKKLALDSEFTMFDFSIPEKSVIRVFVKPLENFDINIDVLDSFNKIIESVNVFSNADGLHTFIEQGFYSLQIYHKQTIDLSIACPYIEIDLEILPFSEYSDLVSQYNCINSISLSELKDTDNISILYDSSQSENIIPLNLDFNSQVTITISYSNILSGYLSFVLSDAENANIAESIGIENLSELTTSLLAGKYTITVMNSQGNQIKNECWPLLISLNIEKSDNLCGVGAVPSKLIKKYGGPQNVDGSVSFFGTFRISDRPDVVFIESPLNSFLRVFVKTFHSDVFVDISLFSDKELSQPVKLLSVNDDKNNRLYELSHKGGYLVISYITQSSQKCLKFELKIVVEPMSVVKSLLECKNDDLTNNLPSNYIKLDKTTTVGSDNYRIFHDKSLKNPELVHEIFLDIKQKGILSAEVLFEFLTNDMTLELKKTKTLLFSKYEDVTDDELGEILNFSSLIEGFEIDPGSYSLFIRKNDFFYEFKENLNVCYPFAFEIEFIVVKSENTNTLILVDPNHSTNHSPVEPLLMKLTFLLPLDSPVAYLKKTNEEKILPSFSKIADPPNKLKLKFEPKYFNPGECYELIVEGDVQSDGLKHSFCMMDCLCNPKANAICDKTMACLCKPPYKGLLCFECTTGFVSSKNQCVEQVFEHPEIKEMFFNVKTPVKKGEKVKVNLLFTEEVYEKNGQKLPIERGLNSISKAILIENDGIEIQASNVFPIGKEGLQ